MTSPQANKKASTSSSANQNAANSGGSTKRKTPGCLTANRKTPRVAHEPGTCIQSDGAKIQALECEPLPPPATPCHPLPPPATHSHQMPSRMRIVYKVSGGMAHSGCISLATSSRASRAVVCVLLTSSFDMADSLRRHRLTCDSCWLHLVVSQSFSSSSSSLACTAHMWQTVVIIAEVLGIDQGFGHPLALTLHRSVSQPVSRCGSGIRTVTCANKTSYPAAPMFTLRKVVATW